MKHDFTIILPWSSSYYLSVHQERASKLPDGLTSLRYLGNWHDCLPGEKKQIGDFGGQTDSFCWVLSFLFHLADLDMFVFWCFVVIWITVKTGSLSFSSMPKFWCPYFSGSTSQRIQVQVSPLLFVPGLLVEADRHISQIWSWWRLWRILKDYIDFCASCWGFKSITRFATATSEKQHFYFLVDGCTRTANIFESRWFRHYTTTRWNLENVGLDQHV